MGVGEVEGLGVVEAWAGEAGDVEGAAHAGGAESAYPQGDLLRAQVGAKGAD